MPNTDLFFRLARKEDLLSIVKLLADDPLGKERECCKAPLPESYAMAFSAIDRDANNELVVACLGEEIVGTLQITFIPNLSYCGSWRALVEGVRIKTPFRSRGFGKALLMWAIKRARERGCNMVQLTTNKARLRAKQFYESCGFIASHEGMKFDLMVEC